MKKKKEKRKQMPHFSNREWKKSAKYALTANENLIRSSNMGVLKLKPKIEYKSVCYFLDINFTLCLSLLWCNEVDFMAKSLQSL